MKRDDFESALIGVRAERERVIKYLLRRMDELEQCGKDDSCNDLWHFAEGLIEDITEGIH